MDAQQQPTAAAVAPADELAKTLESMTAEQRNLVSAALESMNKKLEESNQRANTMKIENDDLRAAARIDKSLLKEQLNVFLAQIGPDASKQFGLTADSCGRALEDDNADIVRRQVDRMLMCCNQVMMTKRAQQQQPMQVQPDAAAADVAAEPVQERQSTKRPAEDFEPTDTDAGSKLRMALRAFI